MFPVVEVTSNIKFGPYTIRIWWKAKSPADGANHMGSSVITDWCWRICDFVHKNMPQEANVDDLMFEIKEKFPDLAAVEVQYKPVTIDIDADNGITAQVTHGIVGYAEWP